MLIKIFVVLMLLAIIGSLFMALMRLFRAQGQDTATVRALTIRITLSIALFMMLMAGFYFGVIPRQGL